MSIQISVTVWTVLCFIALMLILDRLLFRPMLGFMDRRQEKIDRARREKNAVLAEREAELRRRDEERAEAQKRASQEAAAALEAAREENLRLAAEKKAENERRLAAERAKLDAESVQILEGVRARTNELAAAFAKRFAFDPEGK